MITIGTFIEDSVVGPHTIITSKHPFYQMYDVGVKTHLGNTQKYGRDTYYCDAVKKYIPMFDDTTERNVTHYKEIEEDVDCKIFLKITTRRGQLIDCDYVDMPSEIEKSSYVAICFDNIFNTDWKDDEIHKFDEYKQLFNNVENSSYMNSL